MDTLVRFVRVTPRNRQQLHTNRSSSGRASYCTTKCVSVYPKYHLILYFAISIPQTLFDSDVHHCHGIPDETRNLVLIAGHQGPRLARRRGAGILNIALDCIISTSLSICCNLGSGLCVFFQVVCEGICDDVDASPGLYLRKVSHANSSLEMLSAEHGSATGCSAHTPTVGFLLQKWPAFTDGI